MIDMKVTRCSRCNKPLALNKTAWTCGKMFCSYSCGIEWAKTMYEESEYKDDKELTDKAMAYFDEIAEEISREDYGATVEYENVYSKSHDITTVFEKVVENDEIISMTVVNWYFGKVGQIGPGELTAVFVD